MSARARRLLPADHPTLAGLRGMLDAPDPERRGRAAACLAVLASGAEDISSVARLALADHDSGVRARAVEGLTARGVPTETLADTAIDMLAHQNEAVRARACWSLGKIGQGLSGVAEVLAERAIVDPALDGRFGAVWALGRLGSTSPSAITALRTALQDSHPDVRAEAAAAVALIGTDALDAELLVLATEDDPLTCDNARAALRGRFGHTWTAGPVRVHVPAVDTIVEGLSDTEPFTRAESAWLLGRPGLHLSQEVVGLIITQALTDPDSDARWAALWTIRRVAGPTPQLVSVGLVALTDSDPDVRSEAALLLAEIAGDGADLEEVREALAVAESDPDPLVSRCARRARMSLPATSDATSRTL